MVGAPFGPDLSVIVEKLIGRAAPVLVPDQGDAVSGVEPEVAVYRTDYPRGGESVNWS